MGLFSSTNKSTSTSSVPQWLEDASKGVWSTAQDIAAGGWPSTIGQYPMYTGTRIAGMTPDEKAAGELIRNNPFSRAGNTMAVQGASSTPNPINALIASAAQRWGGNFDIPDYQSSVDQAFNPYMDNVTEEIRRQGEIERNQLGARAAAAKAFGGDRQAIMEGMQREAEARNIGLTQAQAYERAQDVAFQQQQLALNKLIQQAAQFNTEQNRGLQAGTTLAQIFGTDAARKLQASPIVSNIGQQDIRNLLAYGGLERGLWQAGEDFNYDQFREARDWPVRNLNILQSVLNGATASAPQTTTTSSPGPGIVQQGLGALSLLAGIGGSSGFGWW